MRYPKDHKERTRQTILDTACRCFKTGGIGGVSVVDVMAAAGLTHGGFYSHFDSKDALAAAAVDQALEGSRRYLEKWGAGVRDGEHPFEVIIRNYLSQLHRDNLPTACPLPPLSGEIGRSGAEVRAALTIKLKEIVALLEGFADGGSPGRESAAMGLLATMVGAMALARATDDGTYSDKILRDCRGFLSDAVAPSKNRRRRSSKR